MKDSTILSISVVTILATFLFMLFHYRIMYSPEMVERDIARLMPLTPDSFARIFWLDSLRNSYYGEYLHACFLSSLAETTESKPHMRAIMIVNVTGAIPPTWMEVYYDYQDDRPCYRMHARGIKSWLVCLKHNNITRLMAEISEMCGRYTEPLLQSFMFIQ